MAAVALTGGGGDEADQHAGTTTASPPDRRSIRSVQSRRLHRRPSRLSHKERTPLKPEARTQKAAIQDTQSTRQPGSANHLGRREIRRYGTQLMYVF